MIGLNMLVWEKKHNLYVVAFLPIGVVCRLSFQATWEDIFIDMHQSKSTVWDFYGVIQ